MIFVLPILIGESRDSILFTIHHGYHNTKLLFMVSAKMIWLFAFVVAINVMVFLHVFSCRIVLSYFNDCNLCFCFIRAVLFTSRLVDNRRLQY